MIKVFLIMMAGVAFGYLFRSHKKIINSINKSVFYIIVLLLFVMGISIGANREIMDQIDTVGWRGLKLALAAVAGSILLSWGLYLLFFKHKTDKHER